MSFRVEGLRRVLRIVRGRLTTTIGVCVASAALTACGGGKSVDLQDPQTGSVVTVTGADGASVKLSAVALESAQRVTVEVARDGTGAPDLPQSFSPASSVYQFTPLGWSGLDVEIRVPFTKSELGATRPRLLVAQPGEVWQEVAGARIEGNFLVASVPQLAFAIVAVASDDALTDSRMRILSASPHAVDPAPSLGISIDSNVTKPALNIVNGVAQASSNTLLGLRVQYSLPVGCLVTPTVSVTAQTAPTAGQPAKIVSLGSHPVANVNGAEAFTWPVSASENGLWQFRATAECREPNRVDPRYSTIVAGPALTVNIAASSAPVISAGPSNVSVLDGDSAKFTVVAAGASLSYEWQRSSDGGVSYVPIAGMVATTLDVSASLPDDGALFRARVYNAGGSVLSAPAKLSVAARPVAPSVTSDPSNQAIVAGQTANFLVVGTGKPTPAIQWQMRTKSDPDPQVGWSMISGATANSYTTPVTDMTYSGRQYRAVLSNAAGTATSRAATLTVNAVIVAPSIVTSPGSVDVPAGEAGAFAVVASGSSPLSYQWFKDGVAIVGANASSLLVPANLADLGGSYKIAVQVSNSAGSVRSVDALLTVTAARGTSTRTVVSATDGGVASAVAGAIDLVVPAGSLLTDQTVTLISQPAMGITLPDGFTALTDAVEIGPKDVFFSGRTRMSWPSPEIALPEGTVLAVIKLPISGAKATGVRAQSVNVGRMALSPEQEGSRRSFALAAPSAVLCAQAANFTSAGFETLTSGSEKMMLVAVPQTACTGVASAVPLGDAPSMTDKPCTAEQFLSWLDKGTTAGLLSRHVHCLSHVAEVDLSGSKGSYGKYRLEARTGSHGTASGLSKTYQFSFRLTPITAGTVPLPGTVKIQPVLSCSTPTPYSGACKYSSRFINVGTGGSWSNPVSMVMSFEWSAGDKTVDTFHFLDTEFRIYAEGTSGAPSGGVNFAGPPDIRCDKKMTSSVSDGCVYAEASSVLVFEQDDPRVREAAVHIAEAQGAGSPGGSFLLTTRAVGGGGSPLQRTWVTGLKGNDSSDGANRIASCQAADAVIKLRPKNSATCPLTGAGCDCDEYPFNATWNGAALNKDRTSAKYINASQNRTTGARVGAFYQKQRVLDLTPDPGIVYKPGNEAISIPSGPLSGTDDYWVLIK